MYPGVAIIHDLAAVYGPVEFSRNRDHYHCEMAIKREREREAWNGKTGARVGNIQRYQEAGFRGKFVPSPLNFPIRSRIGTSRRINIDNLSRRATRLALLVH